MKNTVFCFAEHSFRIRFSKTLLEGNRNSEISETFYCSDLEEVKQIKDEIMNESEGYRYTLHRYWYTTGEWKQTNELEKTKDLKKADRNPCIKPNL